jgi:hypothetical protein
MWHLPRWLLWSVAALSAYSIITLLFFFPLLPHFSTHIAGVPEDNMFFLWCLWYGSESLLSGAYSFWYTHLMFHPEGVSLVFCNYYYYGIALATVLKTLLPLPAIYNLLVLHGYIIAGLGAFWLAYELTGRFYPSLVAGFIFAFNPSHFAHSLHHLTIASIHWIPFFVLFYLRALKSSSWINLFLAAGFMVLDALCDWNYLLYDLIFASLAVIYLLFKQRDYRALGRAACIPLLACIVLSPLIVPMLRVAMSHPFAAELGGHNWSVADFFGFFVPDPYHLAGKTHFIAALNGEMTGNNWEKTVYFGLFNLLFIGAMARFTWPTCKHIFGGFFIFLVLAMGSHPHFLGTWLPVIFPYHLLEWLPVFAEARNPSRIVVYAYLFLSLLVAFSLLHAETFIRSKVSRGTAYAAAFLFIFFDFYAVVPGLTEVSLPSAYAIFQNDSDPFFAIYELPKSYASRYMMYQTIHHHPTVQGYMGRRPERSLIDRLASIPAPSPEEKEILKANRVKYIAIHKAEAQRCNPQILQRYAVIYEKIHEDAEVAVLKVY